MLPDMACFAVKLLPEGKNSLCLTQLAMLQLLHEVGRRAVWQSGQQFLSLAEGCFLQGMYLVGAAAQGFSHSSDAAT